MFNEQMKQEYIAISEKRNSKSPEILKNQFNKCAPVEEEKNKDIASFTKDEVLEYYKSMDTKSLGVLVVVNNHFAFYYDWLAKEKQLYDANDNPFRAISMDELGRCISAEKVRQSIVSRNTLLHEVIPHLPNMCECFLVLALFEGIGKNGFGEFVNLRISDFHGNTVDIPGRPGLRVSSELVSFAEQASEEYIYHSPKGDRKFRAYDDRILKDMFNVVSSSDSAKERNIYKMLVRVRTMTDMPCIDKTNLKESGRIEMIREKMAYHRLSAQEIIEKYMDDLSYRWGRIPSVPGYMRTYGEFLK